jgi:hypothetical protein
MHRLQRFLIWTNVIARWVANHPHKLSTAWKFKVLGGAAQLSNSAAIVAGMQSR